MPTKNLFYPAFLFKQFLLIFLLILIIGFANAQSKASDWQIVQGKWRISDQEISPIASAKSNDLLVNKSSLADKTWDFLSVDFQSQEKSLKDGFGLLLGMVSSDDYQYLKVSSTRKGDKLQLMHWKYGYARLIAEFPLAESIQAHKIYTLNIERAPGVDLEDWRPWKVNLIEKGSGRKIFRQGVENEISTYGMGKVGLMTSHVQVIFTNFTYHSQDPITSETRLKIPAIFSDGMILQHGQKNPIWGKAKAGANVTITIKGKAIKTLANAQGNWKAELPALSPGEDLKIQITSAKETINIKDVAVGEVWLASGQSNMEMRVWQSDVGAAVKNTSKDSQLRLFMHPQWPSEEVGFTGGGSWQEADSSAILGWSAVAYQFAKSLRQKLHMPVGIIASYWGGTAVESWFPREALADDPITLPILDRYQKSLTYLKAEEPLPFAYPFSWDASGQRHTPGNLYNGMIHPLIPYSIKGVIWYQGESNTIKARQYGKSFPMLINQWRRAWNNPDLFFMYVQLAGYDDKQSGSEITSAWPQLRDIQRQVQNNLPNTGMFVAFHLGDSTNIHPIHKQEIGIGLANLALHDAYNDKDIISRGPLYHDVSFKDGIAQVNFHEIGQGLATKEEGMLSGFTIAGKDGVFYPAKASISSDKKSVNISSSQVAQPVAVRYAWENYSIKPNLINSAGLPASPFRTDDWPLPTDQTL